MQSKAELEDRLAVLLGGRAAEEMVFGEITTGAYNDIERATQIARHMVCQFGMSERIGPLSFGPPDGGRFMHGADATGGEQAAAAGASGHTAG